MKRLCITKASEYKLHNDMALEEEQTIIYNPDTTPVRENHCVALS